jgi:hypothetical protein
VDGIRSKQVDAIVLERVDGIVRIRILCKRKGGADCRGVYLNTKIRFQSFIMLITIHERIRLVGRLPQDRGPISLLAPKCAPRSPPSEVRLLLLQSGKIGREGGDIGFGYGLH